VLIIIGSIKRGPGEEEEKEEPAVAFLLHNCL
jgi:hypothetical protein